MGYTLSQTCWGTEAPGQPWGKACAGLEGLALLWGQKSGRRPPPPSCWWMTVSYKSETLFHPRGVWGLGCRPLFPGVAPAYPTRASVVQPEQGPALQAGRSLPHGLQVLAPSHLLCAPGASPPQAESCDWCHLKSALALTGHGLGLKCSLVLG